MDSTNRTLYHRQYSDLPDLIHICSALSTNCGGEQSRKTDDAFHDMVITYPHFPKYINKFESSDGILAPATIYAYVVPFFLFSLHIPVREPAHTNYIFCELHLYKGQAVSRSEVSVLKTLINMQEQPNLRILEPGSSVFQTLTQFYSI